MQKPTQDQLNNFKYQWSKLIKDYRLAGLLVQGAYKQQNQNYQIPLYMKLTHDELVSTAPPVERLRRYKILDVYGNSWNSMNPLKIDERLTYVAGSFPLPSPNGPGWSIGGVGDNDLRDGPGATLQDTYGRNSIQSPTLEVDYWQRYYASNFNAPNATFPSAPSLPGVVIGGVPLILILPTSPTSAAQNGITSCGYFGLQSIRLSTPSVQFNGDNGPHGVCAYR